MDVTTIVSKGLAALSYFVESKNEAIVIDPRRDAQIYEEMALERNVDIKYVLESHRNEDLIIGSLELQNLVPSLEIIHSKHGAPFKYGEHNVGDGEKFEVGDLEVECIYTPGHTNDSVCYAVTDTSTGDDPVAVFTGDTLFVNDVGRTDLVDIKKHEEQSRKLYHSLHDKVLELPDSTIVYPAHGAGSVCGADMAARPVTTIGYERMNNPWLNKDEEEFVEGRLNSNLMIPDYFTRCEVYNLEGPPLLSEVQRPRLLGMRKFAELMHQDDHVVLDTRTPSSFVSKHIPDSIFMGLQMMGIFLGWVADYEDNYLVVVEDSSQLETAWNYMVRLGYDGFVGALSGGLMGWEHSGRPVASVSSPTSSKLKQWIDANGLQIIDVREEHEVHGNLIPGSRLTPLTEIRDHIGDLDPNKKTISVCPSGFRSTIGASILKREGFEDVAVPLGGTHAWENHGYELA
ncbi:MAG: MBL fold metallo-hydrolase [Candidatus Lokiarchaeota archaeon]|nr:MBL fold metallo-hydrolase [Candidatus Lokiarchaeota archaeon]